MQFLIQYAIRWRLVLMALGIVTLAGAYPVSTRLTTEQSVSSLFGDQDITLQQYENLKRWFGEDDVLVLMYRDEALPTPGGIERSRRLTEKVRALEGVTATLSPWVLNEAAEGMNQAKLLPFGLGDASPADKTPALMRPDDPVGKGLSDIFSGYTHSADYSHAAVVVMIDDQKTASTVAGLRDITTWWSQQQRVSNVSLVGEPVLVDEAFALVRRDGARLALVTIALLSLVLVLALLDVRLVLLLALVIGWSVVLTKATMFLAGISLSLIASILTAIVTVVAVTAVLHLGVRYHSRRGRGFSQIESTEEVMQRMAAPIFWTCATDAAGFAALCFSEILPVRQFGLMVALAAMNVFVAILLFTPTCLMLPELRWIRRIVPTRHLLTRTLRRLCFRVAAWFAGHRKWTVSAAAVVMVVAIVAVTRGETETSFLRNFRPDSTIVQDYGNVENNLGGAGVWDLVLDVPATLSNPFLSQVQTLQRDLLGELGGEAGLSKAISIADATEVLGRSSAGKWMPASVRIAAMRTRLPTFIGALISEPIGEAPQRRKLRVMLRSPEGLSADTKRELIANVQRIAAEHLQRWDAEAEPTTAEQTENEQPVAERVTVTGYYVIMTRLVDQLVSDQWRCFIVSAMLIWLLMGIATRSLRLATAALVPNLLPAFLVLAAVSLGGGRINMGAAMIAAVSVGLSIDGSVHLLTVYRRRRAIGRPPGQACVSAAGNIGAPVMLATFALVAGFSVLSTSEFIPTATFGTLVAWTLVIGTLINLSVLPALVRSLDR
ncbi:MMPL family transporter [Stieleria sp. ICT_E10.1]|uniref:efflux RND transporter permease subunit n=1 Tax=Stieleria sedimenti TaxID=2976331 RepID=UPI00217FAA41|nr:MMPL family transporter [Stieleria sedimenti]MCS7470218.1 MMPL family transporter [Stieleria sedimenti]